MNILRNAALLLANTLKVATGETITYRRGNDSIDGLTAVMAQVRNRDLSLDPNVSITGREQDFLIKASDLAIGGQLTLPKSKDEIDWIDESGTKHTFLVSRRVGDRCYRYSDQTRQILRVFAIEKVSGE